MIPIVDPKKNYWVIRADGGFYFSHFIRNGFVALSHIDALEITSHEISSSILNNISLLLPYSAKTSRQSQVFRFIDKIKINDWVITIGKKILPLE